MCGITNKLCVRWVKGQEINGCRGCSIAEQHEAGLDALENHRRYCTVCQKSH
jgi:hypothetical protein